MASLSAFAETYRRAAVQHVDVARFLWGSGKYALSQYVAGLSVECMLRAYCALYQQSFDERHDIGRWFVESHLGDLAASEQSAELAASVGTVVALWHNGQRYYDDQMLRAEFRRKRHNRGIKGDYLKVLSNRTVDAALTIVTLGDIRWESWLQRYAKR